MQFNIEDPLLFSHDDYLKFTAGEVIKSLKPGDSVRGYTVVRELGAGAFGSVYHVKTPQNVDAALKIIPKINNTSFIREVRILKYIRDKIAPKERHRFQQYIDSGNLSKFRKDPIDGLFIVSELVNGIELADVIKNRTLTQREKWGVIDHLLTSLNLLHNIGLIHNDLKVENIMVRNNTFLESTPPVIMDYGTSCTLVQKGQTACRTMDNLQNQGSASYMSPIKRKLCVDYWNESCTEPLMTSPRFDSAMIQSELFAVGVIIWVLMMNDLPWTLNEDDNVDDIFHEIANTDTVNELNKVIAGLPDGFEKNMLTIAHAMMYGDYTKSPIINSQVARNFIQALKPQLPTFEDTYQTINVRNKYQHLESPQYIIH